MQCCSSSKKEKKIEEKLKKKLEGKLKKLEEKLKELEDVIQSNDVEKDQLKQSKKEFGKARHAGLSFENEKCSCMIPFNTSLPVKKNYLEIPSSGKTDGTMKTGT